MNYEEIKMTTVMVYWILTALFVALTRIKPLPGWLYIFLVLLAVIFLVLALFVTFDWVVQQSAIRMREVNYARTVSVVQFAHALKGLDRTQTEMVKGHLMLEASGLDNPEGDVVWKIAAPQGDIPVALIADYLQASEQTYPHLFPIHQHSTFRQEYGWDGAEQWLTIVSRFFVWQGYAEQASGTKSAKLKVTMPWLMEHFRL